jgi:argininosuccinate lyase
VALERAEAEAMLPVPGHTHLQQAMPSSLGLWWAGHAEAFIDDAELAGLIEGWLDASPLGTASGFGVNLPLDRDGVAQDLGFARLVVNPQYAQNARGKIELRALDALAAATGDLRRLAWDLSLYASEEFGFLEIGSDYCTGSSIMPNKRNPDAVELLRSLHSTIVGARAELESILSLPSGYQRDLQDTKPPLIRAFERGLAGLELVPGLLESATWQETRMREAIAPALHATDRANELVGQGQPFREAYRVAAAELDELGGRRPDASLEARVSPGGCANLLLDRLRARLAALPGD